MQRLVISFALLMGCGFANAIQPPPQHVRICVQYLALPHSTLTELLARESTTDSGLHERVTALAKDGKARLLDSSLIVCRSGRKATVESIREEIYPTEYEPPSLGCNPAASLPLTPSFMPFERAATAFETRNTGITLEVEPCVSSANRIDLRIVPEVVHHLRLDTFMEHSDRWGKADIRMPVFETWRSNNSITLKPATFSLFSVINPKRQLPVPFVDTRVLLFVRADILGTALE